MTDYMSGTIKLDEFTKWYTSFISEQTDAASSMQAFFSKLGGALARPRQKKLQVLSFSSQASKAIMGAQISAVTAAIVKVACPENSVLHEMHNMEQEAKLDMGELAAEQKKSIWIVYDDIFEAASEAKALQTWLVSRTELREGQVMLLGDARHEKHHRASNSIRSLGVAMKRRRLVSTASAENDAAAAQLALHKSAAAKLKSKAQRYVSDAELQQSSLNQIRYNKVSVRKAAFRGHHLLHSECINLESSIYSNVRARACRLLLCYKRQQCCTIHYASHGFSERCARISPSSQSYCYRRTHGQQTCCTY